MHEKSVIKRSTYEALERTHPVEFLFWKKWVESGKAEVVEG